MKHTVFNSEDDKFRNKEIKNYVVVKVVIDMVCGNTKKQSINPAKKRCKNASLFLYTKSRTAEEFRLFCNDITEDS